MALPAWDELKWPFFRFKVDDDVTGVADDATCAERREVGDDTGDSIFNK